MGIQIRKITINELDQVLTILNHIPEFDAVFYKQKLYKRLIKTESIILIAEFAGKPIGCIMAYNRYFDGSIYSWLGGVLSPYRNQGIATALLDALEKEANKKLFLSIRMITRNYDVDMLRFSLKRGFQITEFHKKENNLDSRIELKKLL